MNNTFGPDERVMVGLEDFPDGVSFTIRAEPEEMLLSRRLLNRKEAAGRTGNHMRAVQHGETGHGQD